MATADEVYLPEDVERGAVITFVTSTEVHEGDDGSDDRYQRFPFPKLRAEITYGPEYVAAVETLFWTQGGPRYSFLFRPPLPRLYTADRQEIGIGDGATDTIQLKITKDSGVRTVQKNILHPRADTVRIWLDDVELDESQFSVGALGVVTFLSGAPAEYDIIEAAFEYDTAVHFVADEIDVSIPDSHIDGAGAVTFIESIRRLAIEEVFNE